MTTISNQIGHTGRFTPFAKIGTWSPWRRREADRWFRSRRRPATPSRFAWRADQLTSNQSRRSLERSLMGIVNELTGPPRLPGASPLNRGGLWTYVPEIKALASRLGDFERSVTPAGMLLVRDLLTDGGSPLYDRDRVHEMPETVETILVALGRR